MSRYGLEFINITTNPFTGIFFVTWSLKLGDFPMFDIVD